MKRIIFFILLVLPMMAEAQRVEVVAVNKDSGEVIRKTTATEDEDLYIAIFAYGLPREIVRTNSEMADAVYSDGTSYSNVTLDLNDANIGYIGKRGITQRHHTTKGIDEPITTDGNETADKGHNVNHKITFAYLIAPYNVDAAGAQDETSTVKLDWSTASGWNTSLNGETGYTGSDAISGDGIGVGKGEFIIADSPTGCAAYKGLGGKDEAGTWRLPTQRESQVMFTIIEQALGLIQTYPVKNSIMPGDFWTSTEFFAGSQGPWEVWVNNSISGSVSDLDKTSQNYARCIRDIYYKVNDK